MPEAPASPPAARRVRFIRARRKVREASAGRLRRIVLLLRLQDMTGPARESAKPKKGAKSLKQTTRDRGEMKASLSL